MDKKTNNKRGMSKGAMVAIGAGAAALGAGAYYLLGPKRKEHQKKAKAMMDKMKKEVIHQVKNAKEISLPIYHKVVDSVAETYSKEYEMHEAEIKALAKKLKGQYKSAAHKAKSTIKKAKKKI